MNVLFVCSGNTCRSPMAEGYLNSKSIKNLYSLSCGFLSAGDPAAENAIKVMREIGVEISNHKSRIISPELIGADKIFCMSESHKFALISAGVSEQKISVLGGGICDPYGGDENTYRTCRNQITAAVDGALYGGEILPIKIVQAQKNDVKDIAELEKECFSLPWSENGITEAMNHNTVFFKALYKNEFAGYISVTAVVGEGYINNIAVRENMRGKGIGSLLLDRTVTFAKEEDLEFLSLEVRASNAVAISLYNKLDFKKEGVRTNFYESPKEDGIIMTRRFTV